MAAGIPSRRSMVVLESRELPVHFTNAGSPNSDMILNLKIALTAADRDGLEQKLLDVSTPGNALYGQHLSYEETKAFAGPSPDTVQAVTDWLNENGVANVVTTGAFKDWLAFSVPLSTANSLFEADYQLFNEVDGPNTLTRTLSYSIPVDLQQHINLVHPSTDFVRVQTGLNFHIPVSTSNSNNPARALTAPSSCDSGSNPTCLQDLYGIPTSAATETSNTLAVSGFLDEWPQNADMKTFLENFAPNVPSTTTWNLQTLDGGSDPQSPTQAGTEANLDVQYTIGIANGVPVTFISVGADNQDGFSGFIDVINSINAQDSPPHVFTTSYGFEERDVTTSQANQLCDAYMAAGVRGTSVLFSSGDGGVSGSRTTDNCTSFVPTFPSGCPYLTSVGATQGVAETAASLSAGGFSNIFGRPPYQSVDVDLYLLELGLTDITLFNPVGRGYPDVAAQGVNVAIVNAGKTVSVDGTSCSSPIFASVIALINDRLVAAGKSPLGFLNPFLYANPDALFDITSGSNPGCNTQGFPAKDGWDPVTGLGTPNFAKLAAAAGV
ncbi:family S53 protease-like protein [Rhodocollybia butyracea]|uniref:tripeptidyl-peptidase II n=1 Tax=Rhodocollybia butyracea TaxID=206335 RepID=A0A9P5PK72_9AGAR|nr:family S53 protease-like protein [Rhodocollybia butyracea]